MKKTLVNLLLLSTFSLFTSYNPQAKKSEEPHISLIRQINNSKINLKRDSVIYIPFEKELREIEQEKYDSISNNCRHKSLKYSKVLEKNGETTYLLAGWIPFSKKGHTWICALNKETDVWHLIDPTDTTQQDGLPLEYYLKRKWYYLFDEHVSLKDVKRGVNYLERNGKTINQFNKFLDSLK